MLADVGGHLPGFLELPDLGHLSLEDSAPIPSEKTRIPKASKWAVWGRRGQQSFQMSEHEAVESLKNLDTEIGLGLEKLSSVIHQLGTFSTPSLHQCLIDLSSVSTLISNPYELSEDSVQRLAQVQKQMKAISFKIQVQKQLCLDRFAESVISGIDEATMEGQAGCSHTLIRLMRESVVEFVESGVTVHKKYGKVTLKCRYRSGQIQVLAKELIGEGGMKSLEKNSIFCGPVSPFGRVFIVAKPRKLNPTLSIGSCWASLNDELLCAQSLKEKEAHHIIEQLPVYKEKNPQMLKGLAMPWCDKGDVRSFIEGSSAHLSKLELLKRLQIMRQVAIALSSVHEQGFVHCDVKPANIFLKSTGKKTCDAFLGDFGLAMRRGDAGFGYAGTYFYMAPEVWCCRRGLPAIDMWAFGLIMLQMFCGKTERSIEEIFPSFRVLEAHRKKELFLEFRKKLVESLNPQKPLHVLIEQLLREDPADRPTASCVVRELERMIEEAR